MLTKFGNSFLRVAYFIGEEQAERGMQHGSTRQWPVHLIVARP